MTKYICLLIIFVFLTSGAFPQMSKQAWNSINKLSNQDHQLMLKQLGITELRPGPSGNPQAPDAANTDESKASPYKSLPDPLIFKDGSRVSTPEMWEKRRLEIMEDFD